MASTTGTKSKEAPTVTTERSRLAQSKVATASFLTLFSIVGLALYGLPFYYDFMVRDLGWTRAQVTSGNAYSKLLIGPIFGFIAGWIIDRFGPRRLMVAGILMAGIALMGLSRSSTLTMFYFFYLFNALGYVCGGPLPNQVLLSRWFDKARGKAMGFAYLGIGIGGAIVPLLSDSLSRRFGWRAALMTLGILVICIALPMVLLVGQSPDGQSQAKREPPVPVGGVLKGIPFYLLAAASMCSIGAVGGTNQNLKLYLTLDCGYGQDESARLLSIVLASSLLGRLLMGWLADRFPKKYVMLLIYSLVAGAVCLLLVSSSPRAVYSFAVIFGIGLGGDYMIIPLMAGELFGIKALGRVMGIILTADGVGEALVPMIVARMRDQSGSYASGFTFLASLAVMGAIVVALLPRASGAATVATPNSV
jgi:sugar phosphate permease